MSDPRNPGSGPTSAASIREMLAQAVPKADPVLLAGYEAHNAIASLTTFYGGQLAAAKRMVEHLEAELAQERRAGMAKIARPRQDAPRDRQDEAGEPSQVGEGKEPLRPGPLRERGEGPARPGRAVSSSEQVGLEVRLDGEAEVTPVHEQIARWLETDRQLWRRDELPAAIRDLWGKKK